MRNLILIFTLFIGLSTQAQESVLVVSQIDNTSVDGHTYTHIKGDDNLAVNCFTASSSITLAISVDGPAVDNVYVDGIPFSWTGYGAEALALSFTSWDGYNRVYRNRGSERPVYVDNHPLLSCGGWTVGSGGQIYSHTGFAGYTYNDFPNPGGISAHVFYNGVRIPFGITSPDRATLERHIERIIRNHMASLSTAQGFSDHFDGTEGSWVLTTRVAGAGSTTYVWTNAESSREITYNTYAGNSQLWNITGSGDDREATLQAATTQSSHGAALTWATNLIRVSEAGARHRAQVELRNEFNDDVAAIVTDRSMRYEINSDYTTVRLWSVVGHAPTSEISIRLSDTVGSLVVVRTAYNNMVDILERARRNGHLND